VKILLIDNNITPSYWGATDLRKLCQLATGAEIHTRRGPHDDLPSSPTAYDRVVVSGSLTAATDDAPWIERLLDFTRQCIDLEKPYLGVCYGHQTLVRAVGGKTFVRRAEQGEFGWTKIEITGQSALLAGLPGEFYSFESHYDEVSSLPTGMKNFARSELCAIQACQVGDRPIYGIQFHPEKTGEDAGDMKHVRHSSENKKHYRPEIGETIFKNFFKA
jgi:GMP synthase-like glutamine amidotransferase